ncbi:MAG TPA: DUF190 domain-containing protein [Holophaga sp.]|nr:DUF190 domain-containing protein [Holophaga sp.]
MKLQGEGKLLRIFIGESDRVDHRPLHEAIVKAAREHGLAGATVLRGIEGFGANSRFIHTAKILRLAEDLPIIVEIVDAEDRIQAFQPVLDGLLERAGCSAMVTLERVEVLHYGPVKKAE